MAPNEQPGQGESGEGCVGNGSNGVSSQGMASDLTMNFLRRSLSLEESENIDDGGHNEFSDDSNTDVSPRPSLALSTALVCAKECIPEGLGASKNRLHLEARLTQINTLMFGSGGPFENISPNGNLQPLVENVDFCTKFDDSMKKLGAILGAQDVSNPSTNKRKARRSNFFRGFAYYKDEKIDSLTKGQYVAPDYVNKAYDDYLFPAYRTLVEFKERFDKACNIDKGKTRVVTQAVPNGALAGLESKVVLPKKARVAMEEDTPLDSDTDGLLVVAPNVMVDERTGEEVAVFGEETFRPTGSSLVSQRQESAAMIVAHFREPLEGEVVEKGEAQKKIIALKTEVLALLGKVLLKAQSLNNKVEMIESIRASALFLMELNPKQISGWKNDEKIRGILSDEWRTIDKNTLKVQVAALILTITSYLGRIFKRDDSFTALDFSPENLSIQLQDLRTLVESIAPLYEAFERNLSLENRLATEQQKEAMLTFCSTELPRLIERINNVIFLKAQTKRFTTALYDVKLGSFGNSGAPVNAGGPGEVPSTGGGASAEVSSSHGGSTAVGYEANLGTGVLAFARNQVAAALQESLSSAEATPDVLASLKSLIAQGVAALESTDASEGAAQKRKVALVGFYTLFAQMREEGNPLNALWVSANGDTAIEEKGGFLASMPTAGTACEIAEYLGQHIQEMIDLVGFFDGALPEDLALLGTQQVFAMSPALGSIQEEFDREAIEIVPVAVQAINVNESPQGGVADLIQPAPPTGETAANSGSSTVAISFSGNDPITSIALEVDSASSAVVPSKRNGSKFGRWGRRIALGVVGLLGAVVAGKALIDLFNKGEGEKTEDIASNSFVGPVPPTETEASTVFSERADAGIVAEPTPGPKQPSLVIISEVPQQYSSGASDVSASMPLPRPGVYALSGTDMPATGTTFTVDRVSSIGMGQRASFDLSQYLRVSAAEATWMVPNADKPNFSLSTTFNSFGRSLSEMLISNAQADEHVWQYYLTLGTPFYPKISYSTPVSVALNEVSPSLDIHQGSTVWGLAHAALGKEASDAEVNLSVKNKLNASQALLNETLKPVLDSRKFFDEARTTLVTDHPEWEWNVPNTVHTVRGLQNLGTSESKEIFNQMAALRLTVGDLQTMFEAGGKKAVSTPSTPTAPSGGVVTPVQHENKGGDQGMNMPSSDGASSSATASLDFGDGEDEDEELLLDDDDDFELTEDMMESDDIEEFAMPIQGTGGFDAPINHTLAMKAVREKANARQLRMEGARTPTDVEKAVQEAVNNSMKPTGLADTLGGFVPSRRPQARRQKTTRVS
ncbi:MAG: hypothetical protein WC882_05400 [Candidatus Gracilibacteria bacterium]